MKIFIESQLILHFGGIDNIIADIILKFHLFTLQNRNIDIRTPPDTATAGKSNGIPKTNIFYVKLFYLLLSLNLNAFLLLNTSFYNCILLLNKSQKIILFKSLRNSKRRNKRNFTPKSI